MNIDKTEVFFTSGATESNNIALKGLKEYANSTGKKHIITTAIEHKSVLETARALEKEGFEVDYIVPGISGRISVDDVLTRLRDDTLVVSIMHVNNETGIIQPVDEIGNILYDKNVLFHIDATQSFGKLVEELQSVKYDMLSMSAHKINGPQGIGALVLRKKHYKLPPVKNIMHGGQQEHGIRPGTIPVALVAGLGKASEIAMNEYRDNYIHNLKLKDKLLYLLDSKEMPYEINGDMDYACSSTLNISLTGVSSEALMLATKQYCGISNGSACNSNSYEPSYVLTSMGLDSSRIKSSVRISWGRETKLEEFEELIDRMLDVAKKMAL